MDADPLYVMDRDEWRDIMRQLRPDLTDDDFLTMWDEFQDAKAKRTTERKCGTRPKQTIQDGP